MCLFKMYYWEFSSSSESTTNDQTQITKSTLAQPSCIQLSALSLLSVSLSVSWSAPAVCYTSVAQSVLLSSRQYTTLQEQIYSITTKDYTTYNAK